MCFFEFLKCLELKKVESLADKDWKNLTCEEQLKVFKQFKNKTRYVWAVTHDLVKIEILKKQTNETNIRFCHDESQEVKDAIKVAFSTYEWSSLSNTAKYALLSILGKDTKYEWKDNSVMVYTKILDVFGKDTKYDWRENYEPMFNSDKVHYKIIEVFGRDTVYDTSFSSRKMKKLIKSTLAI